LKELQNYVKQNHTTGTSWNPRVCIFLFELITDLIKGEDAASYKVSGSASSDSGSAPPPPPGPAPPPPPALDLSSSSSASSGPDMSAVFNALNQGEGVTKGTLS
jgi:adenylyl cyclase-associated protein